MFIKSSKKWISFGSYLLLLCILSSIPLPLQEKIKNQTSSIVSFLWQGVEKIGRTPWTYLSYLLPQKESKEILQELAILKRENHLLQEQIAALLHPLEKGAMLENSPLNTLKTPMKNRFVVARVILREPSSWSSTIWINVGEKDNHSFPIVQKGSPVLIGKAVIGVIDEVEKKRSKVKLISDPSLAISIKTAAYAPAPWIADKLFSLKQWIQALPSPLLQQELLEQLEAMEKTIFSYPSPPSSPEVLGYTAGSYISIQGSISNLLQGNFFLSSVSSSPAIPSLILTSGLDGIFPEGLEVGILHSFPSEQKKEYSQPFIAVAAVENLHKLTYVTILPAQENNPLFFTY